MIGQGGESLGDNNPQLMIQQIQRLLSERTPVVALPVDPPSLASSLQQMIWSGVYVGTVVPPSAISLLNAPQYLTGKVLGDAAATYVRNKLSGKADVVLLTYDNLQFLSPRFVAMRDFLKDIPDVILKDIPGVIIVADITPLTISEEGGAAMMRTILLANPQVDVVLVADTVLIGALSALRAAGKARPDQFLGGIDGKPQVVAEIKNGASPLQGKRQSRVSYLRLCDGPTRRRLDGRQIDPSSHGHSAKGTDAR